MSGFVALVHAAIWPVHLGIWLDQACKELADEAESKRAYERELAEKNFQPGDRVRITSGYYNGRTGTVDENRRGYDGVVCVHLDNGMRDHYAMIRECERLIEEPA